jgi:hypothetical protein
MTGDGGIESGADRFAVADAIFSFDLFELLQRAQVGGVWFPWVSEPIGPRLVDNQLKSYGSRAGTIRQRAQFLPRRQIWRRSALPWVDALGDVPATEQG